MTAFSEDEQLVLNHFFTNLDKPVFFVKNMHPEVWALMQARYSRAKEGLRESFLTLLKEDPENFKTLAEALKSTANQIKMDKAVDKAIQFMEKWVLGYGHSSVAEGAMVGAGLEGISILATKVIEDNRLASYIEKSTRYVKFDRDSFYIDPALRESKYGKEVEDLVLDLFDTYTKLNEPVLEYVKRAAPLKEGKSAAAWERACAARAFDSIRYILPACTRTSIGWTLNARVLAHAIKKMLSHELSEMRELGNLLKEDGKKVLPSLLKYAEENKYLSETEKDMTEIVKKHGLSERDHEGNSVRLVEHPQNIDDMLVAAILYRYVHAPYHKIMERVRNMPLSEKEEIFDRYQGKMGEFDWPMRELEHAYFTWDILVDYGAFRDLQRQRICTQTNQLLTTYEGYDTPPDIVEAGVKDEYDRIMRKAAALFEKLHKEHPLLAQYIVPLAFRKRYLMTANLREMHHIIKLRSTPQGHFSYRNVVREMFVILKKKFPLASKYLVCHMTDDELGRLKSELKTQEKIDKWVAEQQKKPSA
jgi:thymidylate synthase ThyX